MPAPTLRDMLPPSPEELQQQLIGDNQFYRGVVTGAKGITSGSFANDALNAESAGATNAAQLRDTALLRQQEAQAYAPRVRSLRDINGVGDAVDYGLSTVGKGLVSMAPTIAATAAARAPVFGPAAARVTSYAGAAGAGYLQEKGEAALGQYSDPTLAAAPVADRQRAATGKGLVNAALEGIVPAGLTTMAGKNGLGRIIAKDFMTEGATEAAQQYVGHLADKSLDPTRKLDPWDIADAFAGGALTGGAVGVGHGAVHTLATAPKSFVDRTREAIDYAAENAPSPKDFLNKVFNPEPSVENDPVAAGDSHAGLVDAVSAAGDKAGEVLDGLTAKRGEMAQRYADEMLNDPDVPAATKHTILDMGGDYESPQNQATVGTTYVNRKAGEVASSAADFIKGLAPKVKGMVKDFKDGFNAGYSGDVRISRKNLQTTPVTPDEEFSLHKDIIDNLTPAAKRRTDIIRDIPQIASGVSGIINKMSQVGAAPTEKNIAELQQLYSAATTLFADPAKTLKQLSDKLEMKRADGKKITPFMDLLAGVTTAQQDVAKNEGGSYLQARLVTPMGQEQVAQLAKFVDEFGMTDMKNSKQADKVLDGLAVAFGGKQEALQVLDYYSKANKLNAKQLLQYDENEILDPESGMSAKELVPTKTYSFADPKTNRPFRTAERMAKHDAATMRQGTVASDSSKVGTIPYSQYADETGKDHKAEVVRLMNDVKARQEAAYMGYASELGLKGDKRGKLEMAKRFAAERRPSPDAKSTRLADIDRLQGELDMAREAYKQGGPKAALDLYEVNTAEQNEKDSLTATDEDLKAMATNKNDENMVSFTKTDGSKMVLSSQSMMKTQAAKEKGASAARGEPQNVREQRLLKEAIASVLAREDIKSMDEKSTPPSLVQRGRSDDTKAALAEQEDSVAQLKKRLDAAVQEYEDVNDEDARDKTRTGIERNIARLQSQYEAAEGKAPLRAVIRQRQAVYKEALAAINDVDFQEKVDAEERGEETKKGARTFDETTGEQLGAYGDLSKPTRSEKQKATELKAPTTGPGSLEDPHSLPMHYVVGDTSRLRPELRDKYSGKNGIKDLIANGDRTATTRTPPDGVMPGHYITFPGVPGTYQVTGFEKIDLHTPEGREKWSKREGWSTEAAGSFGSQVQTGKIQMLFEPVKKKNLQNSNTPSEAAIDAVYDVAVNENYGRIDTPAKALAFARHAKRVSQYLEGISFDQLEAMDEARSFKLMDLRNTLEDMFKQDGYSAYDWHSLFDGQGTAADRAAMDEIVKQNKQDKQDPSKNNHVPTTEQEVLDEIARIRGKDVAVAFETFAGIGGSGEFSMDKDKTNRLIRIALDAANMKSVAWHESLHDFMAMLGGTREERTIKREMLEATQSPAVAARLRELLKDHPAALEQLTDPEERLAYTYQFWAEGVLQLTPKGDTLMGKVAKLFRDLLGIMSSDAKLEQYLIALHSGQLVDPSTVAQVIEKLGAKTLGNKLESIAGPLADGLSRVFTSATDRLRKHGIAELDELADLFHKDPGHEKGRAGMLQRRAQKEGQFSNAFEKLLEGTTARQRLDALENLQAMRTPSNDLEKGIASLLSNLHTYMLGAGVKTLDTKTGQWHDIRRVTNYFPRNWDADSIRKDEAGFKALLAKNGVPSDQVKAIYDTLAFNGGSTDLMENAKSLGFVPLAVHVNDRALTFINSTNAQYFAKYQNKDLTDIMTTYIRQAAHRAEYTRSFGNDGHVISDLLKRAQANGLTNAEEESLIPTIRGLEGTLGHDMNPALKKAMAGVLTVENVLLMPMAIFSQMIDPVNIAMRTNQVKDAGAAYLRALKDLKKFVTRDKTVDYDRELTKMLGIISTDSMLETMGQTQGSMYMTKTMRDVNKQFFRYNGMEGWNNSMRIAATVAGEQYILANVGNSRAMEELNVDPKNVITLPQGTKFGEPGRMAVSLEQFESTGMSKADAMKAAAQIQEAMFRFVDGAVVRPNAAHRATWMSDPRFQLISHLKQFTYSFQSAVLARAKNEHLHGNSLPMMYLAASVPIMFASDMAKWVLTGTVPKNWTFFDYFTHAVARSGVLGKYEYSVKAAEDAARGNVPGISFAGPAVEHANILAQWIAGAPGSSTDKLIDRSIPLARYA